MKDKIIKYLTKTPEKQEDRVLRFIGSDQSIDRDNERVMVEGWDLRSYKKNPVVLANHNPFDFPVAKTKKVWIDKEKKALMFDIEFPTPEVSSIGDTLYKLYSNGFMNATSVGFRPDRDKITYGDGNKQPRATFNGQELLEISLVSIPANPRALLTSKGVEDAIELKVIDELELDELKLWLDEVLDNENTSVYESPEENQLIEDNSEQTIDSGNTVHIHKCSVCDDELVCVKCKGFTLDEKDSTYLDYFFEDFDESNEINIKSDNEENPYIEELLKMLRS